MVRYKPYERYKDSGVEWIGEIPEHWDVYRVKHKFRVVNGATPNSSESDYWDGDILWVTPVDLNQNENIVLSDSIRKITRQGYQSSGTTMIPPGSLILSTRAPIGYVMEAGKGMCTNQGCKSLVKRDDFSTRFFYYHIYSAKTELQSLGRGTTFLELGNQSLGDLVICFPPANEQLAIADYLDQKTSEIDGLVADKEKLVTLLQEYRQAIISEAVTKGLNPDVKMKDSGVEWIGEIPEHWEVNRVKYLLREIDERSMTGNEDLLSVSQYYGIRPRETVTEKVARADSLVGYKLCKQGDVVINKMLAWQGALGHSKFDGIVSPDYTVIRTFEAVCSRYIAYLFKTPIYTTEFTKESKGIIPSRWRLHMESLGRIYSLVPPFSEQQAIADHLDQKTSEVDDLISGIQESIAQLKSYRQSLISEAVTGKIDVRGVI